MTKHLDSSPNDRTRIRAGQYLQSLLCLLVVSLLGAVACLAPAAHASNAASGSLESEAKDLAKSLKAPGLIVVDVTSQGVRQEAATGVTGTGGDVDSNSVFVWGSVSKSVTAVAVWELAQQGRFTLDTPVADVLPPLKGTTLDRSSVLIRDLIDHKSGLPHDVSLTDDWTRRENAVAVLPRVAKVAGVGEKGKYRYSSLNYLVLQAVVEHVTGQSFGKALGAVVDAGAGLSGVVADAQTFTSKVPSGHVPFFTTAKPVTVGVDSAGWGYGYLAGTSTQLANYVSWQLKNHRNDAPDVAARHKPCSGNVKAKCQAAGLNYESVKDSDGQSVRLVRHSGAVPGYYTHIAFSPEKDRGVVVLSNMYGEMVAPQIQAEVTKLVKKRVLGVDETETGGNSYIMTLVVAGLVLALVAFGALGVAWQLVRKVVKAKRVRSTILWLAGAFVLATLSVVMAVVGVQALAGVSLPVMYRWAPDMAVLIGAILAVTLCLALLLMVRELLWSVWVRRPGREAA